MSITVVPWDTDANLINDLQPDGVFLSNGPGDPSSVEIAIEQVKIILGEFPIFGICLGHQILGLALGCKTYKLNCGHHGANHPIINFRNNEVEITSHNHGFSIEEKSLPLDVKVTHRNLNDNTIAGIESLKYSAFSVQYHPESSPGPHDSRYLFKKFVSIMT